MRVHGVALTGLLAIFGQVSRAEAAPYAGEIVGGPGGVAFSIACPPNQALVGVSGRTAQFVDAVTPLCGGAKWTSARAQGWAGGSGGSASAIRCTAGTFVSRMMLATTAGDPRAGTINSIGIACTDGKTACLSSGEGCSGKAELAAGERSGDVVTARAVHCKPSEAMVGLVGRAGDLVDAVGGICGTAPMAKLMDLPVRPRGPDIGFPAPAAKNAAMTASTCPAGLVWREAGKADRVCVTPEARALSRAENAAAAARVDPSSAYGPTGCKPGFVWREAFPGDQACVTPASRDRVRAENAAAGERG
jgi:hypothetical protein